MANYRLIDLEKFPRKDYYSYFMTLDTKFEMTVKVDVSKAVKKCKNEAISFYAYSIFNLTEAVNKISNFKYGHVNKQ